MGTTLVRKPPLKSSRTEINWMETKTHRHDARGPVRPCDHPGPCVKDSCSCVDAGVACEKVCLCSHSCQRRLKGCSCDGGAKSCRTEQCLCFSLNRECDLDLCQACGAAEVLDPANFEDDNILGQHCGLVNIQRGIPKRTLLGKSEVDGFGLFMGEPVRADEFLGEYVGELLSCDEANRRGAIYDLQKLSYLFACNQGIYGETPRAQAGRAYTDGRVDQVVDATRLGNKFRFINHSKTANNCAPKILLVKGTQRIAMFSTKDISVGEELFFDYGLEYHSTFVSKEAKPKVSPKHQMPQEESSFPTETSGAGGNEDDEKEDEDQRPVNSSQIRRSRRRRMENRSGSSRNDSNLRYDNRTTAGTSDITVIRGQDEGSSLNDDTRMTRPRKSKRGRVQTRSAGREEGDKRCRGSQQTSKGVAEAPIGAAANENKGQQEVGDKEQSGEDSIAEIRQVDDRSGDDYEDTPVIPLSSSMSDTTADKPRCPDSGRFLPRGNAQRFGMTCP